MSPFGSLIGLFCAGDYDWIGLQFSVYFIFGLTGRSCSMHPIFEMLALSNLFLFICLAT